MQNKIPTSIPALLEMATKASNGAGTYGAAVLAVNTKALLDADIAALSAKILTYNTGKNLLSDHRVTVQTTVDEGRLFMMTTRDLLKPVFGFEFNERWNVIGLNNSLAIPYPQGEVLVTLTAFKDFLAANPAMNNEQANVTAARAEELITELKTAMKAVTDQETVVKGLFNDRNLEVEALTKRMSGLIAELKLHLDGFDPRWLAFGLNMPDAIETPDQVEHLKATLIGPTAAALKWDAAARADYYRVFKKVHGPDEDYVIVGSPADLDFTLEDLPVGATIDVIVIAVNEGGEGAQSEKVTIVTHA